MTNNANKWDILHILLLINAVCIVIGTDNIELLYIFLYCELSC